MDNLPYDVLVALSMRIRVEDINFALRRTNKYFCNVFGEEEYWKDRLQQKWPAFHSACSREEQQRDRESKKDPCFWRKHCCRAERLRRFFKDADCPSQDVPTRNIRSLTHLSKLHKTLWRHENQQYYNEGEEVGFDEEEVGEVDISCATFCDNGFSNCLVAADSCYQSLLIWDLNDDYEVASRSHRSRFSTLNTPRRIEHVHEDDAVIHSMKSQKNLVSTGGSDQNVIITDLFSPQGPQTKIRASDHVLSHSWYEDLIAIGTNKGTVELFDIRDPRRRISEENYSFDAVGYADVGASNGIDVQLSGNYVIAAGWKDDHRLIRLFDIRACAFVAENTVPNVVKPEPGGHWGNWNRHEAVTWLSGDGSYWLGAENGTVVQFNSKSLEVERDFTTSLGHTSHIVGLRYAEGHLLVLSRAGRAGQGPLHHRLTVHEVAGDEPQLVWQQQIHSIEGGMPILAFTEERPALAIAMNSPAQVHKWQFAL
ncbi:hypothetical protein RvY_08637 [Ramazzottius varieornatus]|uniref:Uncharacterized protein n=1 Tax=Ramazzottius varieornatus TaxID=947166 RepID=A0A1D1VFR6_RAMVA|nr:hypothetical protein RvY_08637 [Ramazzottius varieornatus]